VSVEKISDNRTVTRTGAPLLCVRLISFRTPTVIEISGEVDLRSAHLITEVVDRVARYHPSHVVLDMAKVGFFCAEGLRALLRARATVTAAGGQLLLRNPSRQTWRILDLTGTDHLFPVDANANPVVSDTVSEIEQS
jgi:anti-sigma B factor antagonist